MQQDMNHRPHWVVLVLHSLAPTTLAVIGYMALAVLIIAARIVGMSLSGRAYPASFDDNVVQGYANFIIQPLSSLANNQIFNSGLTILVWGMAGWVLCALVVTLARGINDWRNTEKDISTPREGVVVRHPLQRSLILRLLWRFFVGILLILYTAAIIPVIRYCFNNDVVAIQSSSLLTGFGVCVFTTAVWTALFHVYVILFRLYVRRTRILGEIIY